GACVDPDHITADVEEAAEPNGLGLFGELSNDAAGAILLKPVGQHFVVHGKIVPFQDADGDGQRDPDVDTYSIEVTAPVMLSVSADGLHGLAGGFVSLANVSQTNPLSGWTRFGVNPTGDASKRQLYLPAAGTYLVAIADTRSLLLSGAAAGAAMGEPDFEYYVSIDQLAATPTALTATDGVATSNGQLQPGEVKLFTVAMGEGINSAELAVTIDHVQESLVVSNTQGGAATIKAVADGETGDAATATATVFGIKNGDQQVVVVDNVFDYSNAPYNYALTINLGSAGALSTTGGTVMQPASDTDFSTFYYDVGNDGKLIGMNVHFSRAVSGVIVDENFLIFSQFTYDPLFGFAGDTFQDYKGLLNHEVAGRYYFLVFDPAAGTADIAATSSYAALMPVAITKGTTLSNQAVNAYGSNPLSYDAGTTTDPWQQFTGSGTGTGAITAAFYKPTTAFGRLDPLTNTCGAACDDSPLPIFTHSYVETGTTRGRILLDDATPTYLVKVWTATTTGTPTFNLDFKPRPATDLGTVTIGTPVTRMDQALDASTTVQRFLVRSAAGNGLVINTHPDQGTLDTRFQVITRDEAASGALTNNGLIGADDSLQTIQTGNGWTAFTVTSAAPIVGGTFDLSVTATAPVTYMKTAGTTAFSDACTGGTVVAMSDLDEGRSTATIATPAGFDYFGFASGQLRVFANGFLSFDTALACASSTSCFYTNADMPAAANPNSIVAPYWDDLVLTGVCQKTSGTKLIIQWTGSTYTGSTAVQFQAILDGANDTVEFVYSGTQAATGTSATIGIENQIGSAASKVGYNTASTVTASLFTPL
ncbi:MAG TPA: hypothetical protein VIV40_25835, partial [Kofleriaceae bacterium]